MATSKTFKLVLTHKWYDMIESGVKDEEYREITPYWVGRLTQFSKNDINIGYTLEKAAERLKNGSSAFYHEWQFNSCPDYCKQKEYTHVQFQRAYPKNPPRMVKEIESIRIATGNPEWGAEPNKLYFVIKLK